MANDTNGPLLLVDHLCVKFGDIEAVRDVSLRVDGGEIVTVLGANGAGKSTTLKAICHLAQVHSGDVLYSGRSLKSVSTIHLSRLGIVLVPERRRLFGGLTVLENLEMGGYRRPRAEIRRKIDEVMAMFPALLRHRRTMAASLSGGEQQMLAIGRALMSDPSLILLDEPTLGLAPILVEQVFTTLQEINKSGTSILLVEQNAGLALTVASRGYVLESGYVVAQGLASDLANDEKVRSAYLGVGP